MSTVVHVMVILVSLSAIWVPLNRQLQRASVANWYSKLTILNEYAQLILGRLELVLCSYGKYEYYLSTKLTKFGQYGYHYIYCWKFKYNNNQVRITEQVWSIISEVSGIQQNYKSFLNWGKWVSLWAIWQLISYIVNMGVIKKDSEFQRLIWSSLDNWFRIALDKMKITLFLNCRVDITSKIKGNIGFIIGNTGIVSKAKLVK